MPRKHDEAPVRITTATAGHSADLRHRQRRYLVSMGIRTLCFVLAVVFMGVTWLMWVFIVASFALPYVAVVMANAGSAPETGELDAVGPDPSLRGLEAPRGGSDSANRSR
jgi:hypothetical protein